MSEGGGDACDKNRSATLVLAPASLAQAAQRWAQLPDDEMHRQAAAACRDRDVPSLQSLMTAYLYQTGKSGARLSPHTVRAYELSVRVLVEDWHSVTLTNPDRHAGYRWVRMLEERGLKPASVIQRLAGARTLYAALRWTGATTADPFRDVRPARDTRPKHTLREPYPDAVIHRLLAAAAGEDRVLLLLGAHAALRVSEIVKLKWIDVDLDAGRLIVVEGKGRKTAPVSLSRTLADALRDLPRINEYVISSYRSGETARRHMERLCQAAGCRYQAVHSLRHSAACRLQIELRDLKRTAQHLRHSSTATTEMYIAMSDDALKGSVGEW